MTALTIILVWILIGLLVQGIAILRGEKTALAAIVWFWPAYLFSLLADWYMDS